MDLRKTINGQIPSLTNPNYFMPPEGDKPVFYSKTGSLLLDLRETYGGITSGIAPDLAAVRALRTKILAGGYFDNADITLDPCTLAPDVFLLKFSPVGGLRTLTFPTATQLITYLKVLLGPENVMCNFTWMIYVSNASLFNGVGFRTTGTNISFIGGNGVTLGVLNQCSGGNLIFNITNITPGSEAITCYMV